jgi:hypothetical protein
VPLPAGMHDFVFGDQVLTLENPGETTIAPCMTND